MYSQQNTEYCPICINPISISGDRQICALSCGHLYCHSCVEKMFLFSKDVNCGICRKVVKSDDIIILNWDGQLPIDNTTINSNMETNSRLLSSIREYEAELKKMEREVVILKHNIGKSRPFYGRDKPSFEKRPVGRPSLVFERVINDGYRVAVTPKRVIVSMKGDQGKFGLKCFDTKDFSESNFLPIHDSQIHEISPSNIDSFVVATVSTDGSLIQTSLRTSQSVNKTLLHTPLWSCEWVKTNCVAAGGTDGKFFIVDGRGAISLDTTIEKGPPITSILRVDDSHCFVVSPKRGVLFDIRASSSTKCFIEGFTTGRSCYGFSQIITSVSRKGSSGILSLQKIGANHKVSTLGISTIQSYSNHARPSAYSYGKRIFIVAPNGDSFSLHTTSVEDPKLEENQWEKYQNRFGERESAPVLDVGIGRNEDIFVAAVYDSLLRVFAIPDN